MAKRVIEFNDEGLGCTNCPYCRKDNTLNSSETESDYRFGFFCTKSKPIKWISYGYENSDKKIPTPDWCELKEIEDPSFVAMNQPLEITYAPAPYVSLDAYLSVNRMILANVGEDQVKTRIKDNISNHFAHMKEFQDAISIQTVEDPLGNLKIKANVKILKSLDVARFY